MQRAPSFPASCFWLVSLFISSSPGLSANPGNVDFLEDETVLDRRAAKAEHRGVRAGYWPRCYSDCGPRPTANTK
jgi:hypothetical protein